MTNQVSNTTPADDRTRQDERSPSSGFDTPGSEQERDAGPKTTPTRRRRVPIVIARRQARRCAVQAIYQWQLTGDEPQVIAEQFKTRDGYDGCDAEYFRRLLGGVAEHSDELDTALVPHLDRPPKELDQVEHAILRLTGFELLHCIDVPWRAAVNEAVELAKMFGASESHKYVNSVLDALARVARPDELVARPRGPSMSGA